MVRSTEKFDIAVIGAGHAGIEAALAAARLKLKTVCFTTNLDAVGNMPCNPAVGGTAKGHLVREIDALGGEMARAADAACIQYRLLNRGKGPAVQSLRAQADRVSYRAYMKNILEKEKNLFLKQAEIVRLKAENGCITGVYTDTGLFYEAKAAVICTGTFLSGRIIIGDYSRESGPDGLLGAYSLAGCLSELGIELMRFKTGTPPRINARSVDFDKLEIQTGDDDVPPFSFETGKRPENKAVCYLTYTNSKTHRIITDNLHRSPLYSGDIKGVGPRYCPSIEDKVVRFKDKERHQIFVEPMGLNTDELYLQGLSSSLPEDVQAEIVHSIPGLENAEIMRPAYAIEYDCVNPLELLPTLEMKKIKGLYGAGQFCGSSGYEEAAAQGLIAGINAALSIKGEESLILKRSDGYIGTLIDDLVTKGTNEPYRMMTSRSEYRLLLRQDNADLRLSPYSFRVGLISKERYDHIVSKYDLVKKEIERLSKAIAPPSEKVNSLLNRCGSSEILTGIKMIELLRRPEISYDKLYEIDKERPSLSYDIKEQVEISAKYEGYIARQQKQVDNFQKLERQYLPGNIDYSCITSLRLEARQKLNKIRPVNLGQASRISGVSPSDIAALMIYLEQRSKKVKGGALPK